MMTRVTEHQRVVGAVTNQPQLVRSARRPEALVTRTFHAVHLNARMRRVHLQIKGGHLDRFLVRRTEAFEALDEGIGDDEVHRSAPCLLRGSVRGTIMSSDSAEVKVSNVKEKMSEVIQSQPDDATYEEIMRELAFERMVARGLEDSRHGRVLSNEEMERRIRAWQK